MPKVTHVKSAKKDNPVVKKGQPYYWWKFRYGGKQYSVEYPKKSQLTQSSFKSAYFDLQDRIEELRKVKIEELESACESIVDMIEVMLDDAESSLSNIPEHLQDTHILCERVEMLEEWKDSFEDNMPELDLEMLQEEVDTDGMTEEKAKDAVQKFFSEKVSEIVDELITADPGLD